MGREKEPGAKISDDSEDYFNDDEKMLAGFDLAWARAALFFRTGHHFGHSKGERRGMSLIKIHSLLQGFQKQLKVGDTMAILHAVKLCGDENLPLPSWLAVEFSERVAKFNQPGAPRSLDQVFSSRTRSTKTAKRAAADLRDWQLGGALYIEVARIADKHRGLSPALDEVLRTKRHNVGKTTATRLVKMIDKSQAELTGESLAKRWRARRGQ